MSTLIVCKKEECMYNKKERCSADVIGIKDDYTCDSFMELPEIVKKMKEMEEEIEDDPCPECGTQLRGKELHEGGGLECPNPKCDYWFCF